MATAPLRPGPGSMASTTATGTPGSGQAAQNTAPGGSPTAIQIHELSQELEVLTVPIAAQQPSSSSNNDNNTEPEKEPQVRAAAASASVLSRPVLRARDPAKRYLPGQPRIRLEPSSSSPSGRVNNATPADNEVLEYLRKCHLTTHLDELLPFMKYIFVQTPSHMHIMPIHHQQAHGREVMVNEQPGLHLLWYYERIFIKPIPAYMYSQAFWTYIRLADEAVYRASVGFMRSYHYLVQYELDYSLAVELRLIPRKPGPDGAAEGGAHPTYAEFCALVAPFAREVGDDAVSRRFRYGELRLTRVNKTTMLFRGKLAYFHIHPQWGSYLGHILAPLLTAFAVLSVILNALQVALAAHEVGPDAVPDGWRPFISVSLYFPVVVMVLIALVVGGALLGVLVMGVKDLIWAKTVRHRRKHGDHAAGEKSYGMVW